MPFRKLALVLCVGAVALLAVSCHTENYFSTSSEGEIPGVKRGDTPDEVKSVLGVPKARANGWWENTATFTMDYEVWYYKGTGRVVFAARPEKVVYATESDPEENGRPD